jgi:hypothetical protein
MRLFPESATYTNPEASAAKPEGTRRLIESSRSSLADTAVPCNSCHIPHAGGSALSPIPAQFAGVLQGAAAAPPPVQKDPAGHCVSTLAVQKNPEAAAPGQPACAPPSEKASAQRRRRRSGAPGCSTARRSRRDPVLKLVPPLHARLHGSMPLVRGTRATQGGRARNILKTKTIVAPASWSPAPVKLLPADRMGAALRLGEAECCKEGWIQWRGGRS